MANYHQVKNAAILTPTTNQDLGSDSNRYSNVFMSGNIVMSNGVTVTSTNVITPKIASVTYPGNDTAADIAGGQTITITGTGFSAGASVLLGTTPSTVVTVVSSTSITFTSPALSAGNYALYVINSDGGTAIYIPGIAYSGTPTWSTSSGNIASVYETSSISSTVVATGDATISYSLNSGTLPTGSTLNSSTGLISGTAPASAGSTTYSFSIRATDGQNQDTDRSFTITVNTDAVTWSSPADNASTALTVDSAMSNVTLSASASSGQSVAYTANALPTGLSISGANVIGTPTVIGNTTSLITATAANSNRTATRTLSWVVAVGVETYWPYVTLLINGEGAAATNNANNNTYVDSSTNAYAVTTSGSPIQGTFSPYSATSWSNYFDGTDDKLTLPSSSAFDLSAASSGNTWTLEWWMYSLATPTLGNECRIFMAGSNGDAAGWDIGYNNNGSFGWYRPFSSPGTLIGAPAGTISLNTWYHIAVVCNAGSARIYVNGVSVAGPTSITLPSSASQTLRIGYDDVGTVNFQFKGYLSNIRIVKGTAVYTSAFTPSTTPLTAITNTVLLTCQSNRFIDNSTNAFAISRTGNTTVTKFTPFNGATTYNPATYGGSMYLDGSSHLVVSSGNLLNVSASDNWTVECWVYWNSIPGGYVHLFIGSGISFGLYAGTYYVTNNSQGLINGGSAVTGQWTHVALVNIASTSYKIYINGVQVATGGATGFTSTTTYIGRAWDNSGGVTGYMSDMRIVRGTAVYTSSFTPPTAPLTAIANTALLISATNAGIIDQTGQNNLTTVGDAKISTAVKKYNSGSIAFDGTGDYLSIPASHSFSTGTGDFTIEGWIYVTDLSAIRCICGTRTIADTTTGWNLGILTTGSMQIYDNTGYAATGAGSVVVNTWCHFAFVRQSNVFYSYINGIQKASTACTRDWTQNTFWVGHNGGQTEPFIGYIDDLRLTRGYARYTGTFTPPTQAFITR